MDSRPAGVDDVAEGQMSPERVRVMGSSIWPICGPPSDKGWACCASCGLRGPRSLVPRHTSSSCSARRPF